MINNHDPLFRMYHATCIVCSYAIALQIINLLLFYVADVSNAMMVFQSLTILAVVLILFTCKQGYVQLATLLIVIFQLFQVSVLTIKFGLSMGYQHFLWIGIFLVAFDSEISDLVLLLMSLTVLIVLILLYEFIDFDYVVLPFKDHVKLIHLSVILHVFIMMYLLAQKFRVLNEEYTGILQLEAKTDSLTNLYNRRAVFERLSVVYEQNKSQTHSLILFDVDDFKYINDNYGHLAGDELLKIIAQKIKHHMLSTDFAGRIGGDEFLIICKNKNKQTSMALALKIQDEFQQTDINFQNKQFRASVTFGIAQLSENISIEQAIKQADDMLYQYKGNKRFNLHPFP